MSTFIAHDVSPTARRLIVSCVVWLAIFLTPRGAAHAGIRWTGSLAVTSDYIQQGLSQTRGEPALQGGLRAEIDQRRTVGAWASQIDRYHGQSASTEIDVYAARAWRLSPQWVSTVTATHYFYPNDTPYANYDYDEIAASLGYRSTVTLFGHGRAANTWLGTVIWRFGNLH